MPGQVLGDARSAEMTQALPCPGGSWFGEKIDGA